VSRTYDNEGRRAQAAKVRDRIVTAGADLLRGSSIRDWGVLTVATVAERAGVSERTVFRHVGSQRGLRDAVMQRFEQEAGVDLVDLQLDDVAAQVARVLEIVAAHPLPARPPLDPTLTDARRRQQEALVAATEGHAEGWTSDQRRAAAAVLDLLGSPAAYERLAGDWALDEHQAIATLTWAITTIVRAIDDGDAPS